MQRFGIYLQVPLYSDIAPRPKFLDAKVEIYPDQLAERIAGLNLIDLLLDRRVAPSSTAA
jgi:hypothetical protein